MSKISEDPLSCPEYLSIVHELTREIKDKDIAPDNDIYPSAFSFEPRSLLQILRMSPFTKENYGGGASNLKYQVRSI